MGDGPRESLVVSIDAAVLAPWMRSFFYNKKKEKKNKGGGEKKKKEKRTL